MITARGRGPGAWLAAGGHGRSGVRMDKTDKQILQVAKEIVVKFVEVGRVSPTNFSEVFPKVYETVSRTVKTGGPEDGEREGD